MEVLVKKKALVDLIGDLLNENRTNDNPDYSTLAVDDDLPQDVEGAPIMPDPQMSTQLATDRPPVEDPDYVPVGPTELGLAASVIAEEVPNSQIGYFYRMLHKLLDKVLDRADDKERNQLQEIITRLTEIDDDEPDDDMGLADGLYTSMFNELLNRKEVFLPAGVVAAVGSIEDTPENRSEMQIKMFDFLASHVDFKNINVNDSGLRSARKRAVQDAVDHYFYRAPPLTDQEKADLDKSAKTGVAERAELKAKQSAIRSTTGLWDSTQGDLDAIAEQLEQMIVDTSGTPEEIYLQHALDTVSHIAIAHIDNVDKTKFKKAIKVVLQSNDLAPTNADDIFEVEEVEKQRAVRKRKKSEEQHIWGNIAKISGFSKESGAKQYTRIAGLKLMLGAEGILSDDTLRVAMSRSSRAFRSAVTELESAGKIKPDEARKLMTSARPNTSGNELFLIFTKEYFWQPFVNLFDKVWKSKAAELYMSAGIPENIAKSDTFLRLATGETVWESDSSKKKIEKVMSIDDFKRVKEETESFVRSPQNTRQWNVFAKDFINKIAGIHIGDPPKQAEKMKTKADKKAVDILTKVLKDPRGELAFVERERVA